MFFQSQYIMTKTNRNTLLQEHLEETKAQAYVPIWSWKFSSRSGRERHCHLCSVDLWLHLHRSRNTVHPSVVVTTAILRLVGTLKNPGPHLLKGGWTKEYFRGIRLKQLWCRSSKQWLNKIMHEKSRTVGLIGDVCLQNLAATYWPWNGQESDCDSGRE